MEITAFFQILFSNVSMTSNFSYDYYLLSLKRGHVKLQKKTGHYMKVAQINNSRQKNQDVMYTSLKTNTFQLS